MKNTIITFITVSKVFKRHFISMACFLFIIFLFLFIQLLFHNIFITELVKDNYKNNIESPHLSDIKLKINYKPDNYNNYFDQVNSLTKSATGTNNYQILNSNYLTNIGTNYSQLLSLLNVNITFLSFKIYSLDSLVFNDLVKLSDGLSNTPLLNNEAILVIPNLNTDRTSLNSVLNVSLPLFSFETGDLLNYISIRNFGIFDYKEESSKALNNSINIKDLSYPSLDNLLLRTNFDEDVILFVSSIKNIFNDLEFYYDFSQSLIKQIDVKVNFNEFDVSVEEMITLIDVLSFNIGQMLLDNQVYSFDIESDTIIHYKVIIKELAIFEQNFLYLFASLSLIICFFVVISQYSGNKDFNEQLNIFNNNGVSRKSVLIRFALMLTFLVIIITFIEFILISVLNSINSSIKLMENHLTFSKQNIINFDPIFLFTLNVVFILIVESVNIKSFLISSNKLSSKSIINEYWFSNYIDAIFTILGFFLFFFLLEELLKPGNIVSPINLFQFIVSSVILMVGIVTLSLRCYFFIVNYVSSKNLPKRNFLIYLILKRQKSKQNELLSLLLTLSLPVGMIIAFNITSHTLSSGNSEMVSLVDLNSNLLTIYQFLLLFVVVIAFIINHFFYYKHYNYFYYKCLSFGFSSSDLKKLISINLILNFLLIFFCSIVFIFPLTIITLIFFYLKDNIDSITIFISLEDMLLIYWITIVFILINAFIIMYLVLKDQDYNHIKESSFK